MTFGFKAPDHPLAKIKADVEHATIQFQSLGCGNCGRVRQNQTWVWRCGLCEKRNRCVLFGGCEDCSTRTKVRMKFEEHVRSEHGVEPTEVDDGSERKPERKAGEEQHTGAEYRVPAVDRGYGAKGVRKDPGLRGRKVDY